MSPDYTNRNWRWKNQTTPKIEQIKFEDEKIKQHPYIEQICSFLTLTKIEQMKNINEENRTEEEPDEDEGYK